MSIVSQARQQGLVLFVALVALVIMSLAAVALIRSVDTNSLIAGNLALKQSTLASADRGVDEAIKLIQDRFDSNPTALDTDAPEQAYYATFDVNGDGEIDENDGNNAVIALLDASNIIQTANDGQGNQIKYIVQRMCLEQVAPAPEKCMLGSDQVEGSTSGDIDYSLAEPLNILTQKSPIYRVTVKVTGPKNTVSYTQSYHF